MTMSSVRELGGMAEIAWGEILSSFGVVTTAEECGSAVPVSY